MKRLCLALSLLCLLPCLPASADSITVQQGSTARKILFLLVQSTDHVTALTGATPTVTLSKNGAAFAAPAGAVTELANGWYVLAPTSADTGAVGSLIVHATATSGDPADVVENVVAYNPDDASLLGLTGVATATTQGTQGTTLGTINTQATGANTQATGANTQATTAATQATAANTATGTIITTQGTQGTTLAAVKSDTGSLVTSVGLLPSVASFLTGLKADALLAKTFNRPSGKYAYNLTTHVMTLLNDDNTTMGTVTLTYDVPSGTITGKQ